jgi:hypothetical protein
VEAIKDPDAPWGWTKGVGRGNEAASMETLRQDAVNAADLNRFTPDSHNFPGLDIAPESHYDRFISCKAYTTENGWAPYRNDFQSLVNGSGTMEKAANNLATDQVRDTLQREVAWPSSLSPKASSEEVLTHIRTRGELWVPDDHVDGLKNFLRKDIHTLPENYGLPEHPPPGTDVIEGLVSRVRGSGVKFDDLQGWFGKFGRARR